MEEFRVVPLRLELKGTTFARGDILRFDVFLTEEGPKYRLWPHHHCVRHRDECFKWFTPAMIEAMQPHWITKQESLL